MSEPPSKRLKQSSILRAFASSRTKTASNIFTDIFNDKYVVHDVAKDGNCLFSALAAGLRLPHTAESVRADVAQYASSHMEEVLHCNVDVMCQKMGFDARPCILDFREYRQHPTTHRPTHFDTLQNAVDTYVVSTAECERSFSVMNDTLSPERNNLTVKHLSELVFIKSVCPPLSDQ